MWRWVVLWQASSLLTIGAVLDINYFKQRRLNEFSAPVMCFMVPKLTSNNVIRLVDGGWHHQNFFHRNIFTASDIATFANNPFLNTDKIHVSPRIDRLPAVGVDVVKEHAKLVQDINGLKQMVFIAPIVDDNRDYDDSVFNEIIEVSTTTTDGLIKSSVKPTKQTSIPIVLLGGESKSQAIKTLPDMYPKPMYSLVGNSISKLIKHPYSFVIHTGSHNAIKFCTESLPKVYTTKRPLTFWQKLLKSIALR